MLVDYRHVFFLCKPALVLQRRLHKYTKSFTEPDRAKLAGMCAPAQAILTLTVMSSKWQTIQGFAVLGSKAGLRLSTKEFSQKSMGHILSFLSILLSISLYLPAPIFHSFSIHSGLSPGITNTSAGGRITDKSPGVLDSATLAGAPHILACRTRCHIGLTNQPHKAAQFKHNAVEPTGPPVAVLIETRLQLRCVRLVRIVPVIPHG